MKKLILSAIFCWTMFSYGQDVNRALKSTEVLHKGKYVIGAVHYLNRVCIMFRDVDLNKIETFYIDKNNYNYLNNILVSSYHVDGEIYELPTSKDGKLFIQFKCTDENKIFVELSWLKSNVNHIAEVINVKQIKKLLGL